MAKYAPVCPIHILKYLIEADVAGDYHLPLAHDVIAQPEKYREVFTELREHNLDGITVILDNSVIELGSAVDAKVIADAASAVQADVIVLPDVLYKWDETLHSCQNAVHEWTPILNEVLGNSWSYMFVPQGRTKEEFMFCAESMAKRFPDLIGWWGVPRNFREQNLGSRVEAATLLHQMNPTRKIHLLGFSNDLSDDILASQCAGVVGIDSAVPVRAASRNCLMEHVFGGTIPPRGNWWEEAVPSPLMSVNVARARELFNTPTSAL